MKTTELRKIFLDYFKEQNHTLVPSSSLVPINDPTLLFTNAGMVQFKDTFLGLDTRSYVRAASCQRCVRAGGKHNDLENVGYTARHHTFFEMLGNFSFGDYFKRDAIQFAWKFLTEVLKVPPSRLWVTVYEKDDETADIWLKELKIDPARFSRCGEKDNFWSMGDTGPCGPCTEIFYDHGPSIAGGPPGSPEEDGDRFVEVWNLVFMQYNRSEDGKLTPLPKPSVDTGMGLERMAAVMQGVHNNYDIDLFKYLIKQIALLGNITDLENKSLRVIADHIRSCAFLIMDGVIPSNEGRGYVLRRICRRAIRHGHRLGLVSPFFHKLVKPLAEVMKDAYPELLVSQPQIEKVLQQEELQFARTLDQGLKILEENMASLLGKEKIIPGEIVFRLYDTYGFPVDLTADIARERGLTLDMDGFEEAMAKQRTRAREASQFSGGASGALGSLESKGIKIDHSTEFTGYQHLEENDLILTLLREGKEVSELKTGEEGGVVLSRTPFYAEAGGQVGDQGIIRVKNGEFRVKNTYKSGQAHVHVGVVQSGTLSLNQSVVAEVDKLKRRATELNHSATHLLHAALRKLLGAHVQQKGSLVEPQRLRFDFTHFEPLTPEQLRAVEKMVNEQIRFNSEVETELMPVEKALQSGAMALFGEKYGDTVRVLHMGGNFSVELCGGTHVGRTGDIGFFKITSESGISAGVRRLEAVTGQDALNVIDELQNSLDSMASILKSARDPKSLQEKIQQLLMKQSKLEKELQALRNELVSGSTSDLTNQAIELDLGPKGSKVKVLAVKVPVNDIKTLREMVDRYKDKLKTAVIVLAAVNDGKVNLIAGVTPDCVSVIHAGELVKEIARRVEGQGGGRPDMAQGGGNNPAALDSALKAVRGLVEGYLKEER